MKDDLPYLLHMRDAINRIVDYTVEGRESFLQDRKTQDAVIRNLEILGEATKNLSTELRSAYPAIPWRTIAGMRDRLVHQYFGVNLMLVWETVEHHIPALARDISTILEQLERG